MLTTYIRAETRGKPLQTRRIQVAYRSTARHREHAKEHGLHTEIKALANVQITCLQYVHASPYITHYRTRRCWSTQGGHAFCPPEDARVTNKLKSRTDVRYYTLSLSVQSRRPHILPPPPLRAPPPPTSALTRVTNMSSPTALSRSSKPPPGCSPLSAPRPPCPSALTRVTNMSKPVRPLASWPTTHTSRSEPRSGAWLSPSLLAPDRRWRSGRPSGPRSDVIVRGVRGPLWRN